MIVFQILSYTYYGICGKIKNTLIDNCLLRYIQYTFSPQSNKKKFSPKIWDKNNAERGVTAPVATPLVACLDMKKKNVTIHPKSYTVKRVRSFLLKKQSIYQRDGTRTLTSLKSCLSLWMFSEIYRFKKKISLINMEILIFMF